MRLPKVFMKYRHFIAVCIDVVIIGCLYAITLGVFSPEEELYSLPYFGGLMALTGLYLLAFKVFHLYKSMWRYANTEAFFQNTVISLGTGLVYCTVDFFFNQYRNIYANIILTILVSFSLIFYRLLYTEYCRWKRNRRFEWKTDKRLLIVGAGLAASALLQEMKQNPRNQYEPICAVDDDPGKLNNYILDIKVEGSTKDIHRLVEEKCIDVIFICIPSLTIEEKSRIVGSCMETSCTVKILPEIYASLMNPMDLQNKMKPLDIHDVLGRKEVYFDNRENEKLIKGKNVLVTGGGGSIGSELCRQIAMLGPGKLIILDINENNAYEIQQELIRGYGDDLDLQVEIASIRDVVKIDRLFEQYTPHLVFHAAAHKHVPLMEHNPEEAVKNNIFGTYNVMKSAIAYHTEKFVLISSDKAVNPTNFMGATKRFTELMLQGIAADSETEFSAVRFGNVLGSAGSVIPLFKKQIEAGGPVTVTHEDIIRYFMTIPEAVQLVLQAASMQGQGKIYVLDMGKPVKIIELAVKMIELMGYKPYEEIPIKITGLRPGEKLYEELLMDEEAVETTPNERIFIGHPTSISKEEIDDRLKEIELALAAEKKTLLFKVMADSVPTYIPDIANLEKDINLTVGFNAGDINVFDANGQSSIEDINIEEKQLIHLAYDRVVNE